MRVFLLYSVQLGGRSPLPTTYRAYFFTWHTANHNQKSRWRHPVGKGKGISRKRVWENGLPLNVGREWPALHSLRKGRILAWTASEERRSNDGRRNWVHCMPLQLARRRRTNPCPFPPPHHYIPTKDGGTLPSITRSESNEIYGKRTNSGSTQPQMVRPFYSCIRHRMSDL